MSRPGKTIKRRDSATGAGHPVNPEKTGRNFCERIAEIFASHVRRSIPYYDDGHELVYYLYDFFLPHVQRANCIFFQDHGSMGSLS